VPPAGVFSVFNVAVPFSAVTITALAQSMSNDATANPHFVTYESVFAVAV